MGNNSIYGKELLGIFSVAYYNFIEENILCLLKTITITAICIGDV
jgi:hypothetical protein